MILNKFYPDLRTDSVASIDLAALWEMGIKALFLDIDNTLAPYDEHSPGQTAIDFIASAKAYHFRLAFLSNNSRKRVDAFTKGLGMEWVHRAKKPLKRSFLHLAKKMGLDSAQVAVIGDQIFTDIYGGNRCGMYTILVNPLRMKENLFFKVKRYFEKKIIDHMEKSVGK